MPASLLRPHQQTVRDFLISRNFAAAYLGVGSGKTLTTLQTLGEIRPSGHVLIIAPLSIARSVWIDEVEKWNMGPRMKSLIVNENDVKLTKAKRLQRYAELFTDPPTIYFINVDLVSDLVAQLPKKNGKVLWPFPTVVIDESQEFKNPSSKRFKALSKVRPAISRMIQLTGTPTPQGPLDLWAQIYLLDQGEALGKTFTQYRTTYFQPTMHIDGRPVKWEPYPWAEKAIYQKIEHLAIHVEHQAADKPDVHDVTIKLPKKAYEAYRSFAREMVLELAVPVEGEDGTTVYTITGETAGVMHNRLLQYASGTMYTGEDHDRDFAVVHTEKLEMTDYILRNSGGDNVIIAYRYRSDRQLLLKHLKKAGYNVEAFDGSREMVHRWNRGEIQVMLLQPASARHGLNMQDGGHTLIWYTLPDSYEHYHQANGRLVRMGQKSTVQIYRLITAGTKDTRMPGILAGKHSTQQGLLYAVKHDLIDEFAGDLVIA